MNKYNGDLTPSTEFDLKDILLLIWKYKTFVSLFTLSGVIMSIFFALSLQNTYVSYAKLLPVADSKNMSSQVSQLSGIAALAGVQVDSGSRSNEAIEKLKSFTFFKEQILDEVDSLPQSLLAIKSWDKELNKLEYQDESYDVIEKKMGQQEAI